MHFKPRTAIPTPHGEAIVDPDRVVMVLRQGAGSALVLVSGAQVDVDLPSDEAARLLWRFTNAADDGAYFNEQHVLALVPTATGCQLLFTEGGSLNLPAPAEVIAEGLRTLNAHRNAMAGQP